MDKEKLEYAKNQYLEICNLTIQIKDYILILGKYLSHENFPIRKGQIQVQKEILEKLSKTREDVDYVKRYLFSEHYQIDEGDVIFEETQ